MLPPPTASLLVPRLEASKRGHLDYRAPLTLHLGYVCFVMIFCFVLFGLSYSDYNTNKVDCMYAGGYGCWRASADGWRTW